ncbi:MAG TPA: choice-of-anchor D domain-containing protein [Candidatus Cloacimonadota bacterium]|nr:choice-of-anchor D domain-containing protein [Candidatus Cloacimonadota bacterium]
MKQLTALSLLLVLVLGLGAATVTAAQPYGQSIKIPVSTRHISSYSQQVYTQSRINHQGEISKIRFYHQESPNGSLNNSHIWKIYMGHTTRSTFSSTSDWEPIANLTEVFSGRAPINLPPGRYEWIEFILDTPFVYNNTDNLIIAVLADNHNRAGAANWGTLYTGEYSALYCQGNSSLDVNNPPAAQHTVRLIPALQLVFPDTEVPVAPELIDVDTLVNGMPLDWVLPQGDGNNPPGLQPDASGYDVYIDGAMVSENQPGNRYIINGLEVGQHTWQVVARNNVGFSPPSQTHDFWVESGVAIGDSSEDYGIPVDASLDCTYSQSIILQSEIGLSNQRIETIGFYWNGAYQAVNSNDWVIYLGHTDKTEFSHSEDWVPVSEMTQVYNGHVNIPAVTGWIEISLDIPFAYNNTDNLVIAVHENLPSRDWVGDSFYCTPTPDQYRSIVKRGCTMIDPNTPPEGYLTAGTPNILMRCGEIPVNPVVSVLPSTLDFDLVVYGEPSTQNVTVTNIGGGIINFSAANVSFVGPNADEFSFDTVNLPVSLGPSQCVQIPVSIAGTTPGQVSATLRVTCEGVNHDVALTADVTSAGVVIIGDGTLSQTDPFGTEYDYDCFATLYIADQISSAGTIDMVAWDCVSISNLEIPYKIYLKNTTSTYLTSPDVVIEQAILVKQGLFVPNTLGWRAFELDVPFQYTGGNLIVIVVIGDVNIERQNRALFSCTYNIGQFHLTWKYTYNTHLLGDYSVYMPNILLNFVDGGVENDICALGLNGPLVPPVGEEAHYTVSVSNSGNSIQSNYQVKLMGPDDTELAIVSGTPINSGSSVDVVIPWTPMTAGQFAIYAKVILSGDQPADANDQTKPLKVDVLPEGAHAVSIGSGYRTDYMPMNFRHVNTLCQTVYLAEELGFVTGTINSMMVYNSFAYGLIKPTQIFMASTYQNLDAGMMSAYDMTLVYNGLIEYPEGENNIMINLQTPYQHTGGNLVVMFFRPYDPDRYFGDLHFRGQIEGDNRSRIAIAYSDYIDPYLTCNTRLTGRFPQASFFFTPDPYENELAALRIAGGSDATMGSVSNYTVHIKNYGSADQSDYTVNLIGSGDVVLASVAGPEIASGQSLEVEIPWTPDTVGELSIFAKVEMNGDEFAGNNRTTNVEVMVYPVGSAGVFAEVNDNDDAVEVYWMRSRELSGYHVYRLQAGQEQNQAAWIELIPETDDASSVTDTSWLTLPDGDYRWAVTATYTDGTASLPRFSSALTNSVRTGKIVGVVKNENGIAIAGAIVSNGRLTTTTNSLGEYSLMVPVGNRTLLASAEGFGETTVENVIVGAGLFTNLDIVLVSRSNDCESPVPVVTALNGNYPNPFNPETNISYSVKEPGMVKLEIYNIRGQLVRNLLNEYHVTGHYKRIFDGKDNNGRILASGVYLLRMSAPGYQKASKMLLKK